MLRRNKAGRSYINVGLIHIQVYMEEQVDRLSFAESEKITRQQYGGTKHHDKI